MLRTLPNANFANTVTIPGELAFDNFSSGSFVSGSFTLQVFNLAPNFLAKSGTEEFDIIDVSPLSPMYALGFSLYEPTSSATLNGSNTTSVESTFSLTFLSGAATIGTLTIEPVNNVLNFYGFWSSDPITRIRVREPVGTNDNEFFGQFYTGETAFTPNVVPEASSWLLVTLGLTGLCLAKRIL